jgi:hypothetical protein
VIYDRRSQNGTGFSFSISVFLYHHSANAPYHRRYIMLATDSVATCYAKIRFQPQESSVVCMEHFTATAEAGNLRSDEVDVQAE